jgi:hypothetical protein
MDVRSRNRGWNEPIIDLGFDAPAQKRLTHPQRNQPLASGELEAEKIRKQGRIPCSRMPGRSQNRERGGEEKKNFHPGVQKKILSITNPASETVTAT